MRKVWLGSALGVALTVGMGFLRWHVAGQEAAGRAEPLTFSLSCTGGDCPLLKGEPQTSGMRGGAVRLQPGESVGWHSTGQNEEALTILQGSGAAKLEGRADVPFGARMLVYIPPGTRHNVTNTGNEVLEYVWVVAPVKGR